MAESRNEIGRAVTVLRRLLAERKIRVNRIVLFGSRAGGAPSADSDADIAIVSPDFEGKDVIERAEILSGVEWELTREIRMPFDIVAVSPSEMRKKDSLLASIVSDGRVAYGGKRGR